MILRLIAILTLLTPALLGWGMAPDADRSCCATPAGVDAENQHCASQIVEGSAGCGDASATAHACCNGAPECACGMRRAPQRENAPKAPLPSRSDRDAPATLDVAPASVMSGLDRRAALAAVRPTTLVILTALRTNNDALAFLSVWRT